MKVMQLLVRIRTTVALTAVFYAFAFAPVSVAENRFLTVAELVSNGYSQLTESQLRKLINKNKVEIRDIETEAVSLSTRNSGSGNNRATTDVKDASPLYFLDTRLLARAPPLEGEPEYKISEDELIATDGVRTYNIRFFQKHGKMYGARDIDNGNVFFEVIVK